MRKVEANRFLHRKFLFVSNTSWSLYNFRLGLMTTLREKGHKIKVSALRDALG